jgi:hypothetical protein
MADVTCAHCGEPWDTYGLRHEASDYLDDPDLLAPLGEQVVAAFTRIHLARTDDPGSAADQNSDADAVNTALHAAVLSGQGCPAPGCGLDHTGPGPHRAQQLRELVIDGVWDTDPATYL